MNKYEVEVTAFAENSVRAIAFYIRNELKAPQAARNTVKMIFDAIFGLDTFPNKVRLTEDEPWKTLGIHQMTVGNYYVYFWINEPEKKVIVTDVIYARRDQVDAMADMPMK
ncbi:MAG: type II toxin-antitoxin system RelE/ParE family toxin [Ruminococcus sp.]|nr:type II toxin-antitoxin system RelE/ParE family toxin [Ruminococcus sp.]